MKQLSISLILVLSSLLSFNQEKYNIQTQQLSDNIYKIEIGTVNLVAYIDDQEILLSDCGFKDSGKQLDSALKTISKSPVKYIINTHWHHDHCSGNLYFSDATIISHYKTKELLNTNIISEFWQDTYLAFPANALPQVTFESNMSIHVKNDEIQLTHFPNGHSPSDVVVYFKNANIIHMGDLLFSFGFPAIDFEQGASVEKFINNLDILIKKLNHETKIVAGHGPDFTLAQLLDYRNMVEETYKVILNEFQKGKNLAVIKQSEILKDYKHWANGYFSCNDWIEIVFSSLEYQKVNSTNL